MSEEFWNNRRAKRRATDATGAVPPSARKREITTMLRRVRRAAGMSQIQLAQRAGWQQPFVSRLESFDGSVPDEETQARYVEACGFHIAKVVYEDTGAGRRVVYESTAEVDAGVA